MTGDWAATLTAVLAVYVLVVMSPGPNFVVVTRYALRHSGGAAFAATLGIAFGATVNACIAMFGAGALIARHPWVGVMVTAAGGGVLIFLGLRTAAGLIGRRAPHPVSPDGTQPGQVADEDWQAAYVNAPGPRTTWGPFVKGALVNLLNPKGIVFFLGLYAPLIAAAALPLKLTVLVVCFAIELLWYGLVILVSIRPAARHAYARAATPLDVAMAMILAGLGARMLLELPAQMERLHG